MKSIVSFAVALASLLSFSLPATAQVYVGGGYGPAFVDSSQPIDDLFSGTTTAFRFAAGYRFNPHLSAEALHVNFVADDSSKNGAPRTHLKQQGTGIGLALGTPLSPAWRVDVKGGWLRMQAEFNNYSSSQVPIGGSTERSWEPWWGLSAAWSFTRWPVALQLDYLSTRVSYGFPLNESGHSQAWVLGAYYSF